ncbi:MAG: hypothetical protein KY469_17500 [Actinobacteria bacterium]|nr:hypothetical protein [Actinomycetota bacterium]
MRWKFTPVVLLAALVASTLAFVTPGPGPVADAADRPEVAIPDGVAYAGVGSRDVSWHLGASGGQFADTEPPVREDFIDPHAHSVKKRPADGIASRILTRALVVEGADGTRAAVVANDLYLPNDYLLRRTAQLIAEHDLLVTAGVKDGPVTGITGDNLAMTVSHNHNSAFYSTPSWGTWIFQDVVDLRFFDYYAQRMADAVIEAASDLRPVRMGAATVPFNEITSHTYGPKVADDGTPAGQPYSHTTGQLSVVRFDDVTDPADPQPFIAWITLGVHPEWTWGYDLFNGDITHATMRVVDRELGVTSVMSQRETGSSGPHKDRRVHEPEDRREFQDNGFEQLDRGARIWADAVHEAWDAIETTPDTEPYDPAAPRRDGPPIDVLGFVEGFTVDVASFRFAPPKGRPVPGVSNCNTASLFHGNWQLPVLGLPDCEDNPFGLMPVGLDEVGGQVVGTTPVDEYALYEQLKAAGVPIPESYTATKFGAVEETAAVHIMAMRFGDLGVTFCPCEQFTDTALNTQTRLDRVDDNVWHGWDWTTQKTPSGREWCVDNGDGTSTCADPRNPAADLAPVRSIDVDRMLSQIRNDADGWEDDAAQLFGEAESADPASIYGNFVHEEATEHGFGMVISVGMANDYFGYVPNYREMRAHDHYRKALNGLGLHGADYLATRMVRVAASLNGGPEVELSPHDLAYQAESARAEAFARSMGELARAYVTSYDARLPADGGQPRIVTEPGSIERFDATHVSWVGGSNYGDIPNVVVEREVAPDVWEPYADMHGELPVRLDFPAPADLPAVESGTFEWVWTAAFEAFSSEMVLPDASGAPQRATPAGRYRFVIDGTHRPARGGGEVAYQLESQPFTVSPWTGITTSVTTLASGDVEVVVGPTTALETDGNTYTFGPIDYPDGYESPFDILNGDKRRFTYGLSDPARHQFYCSFCRFRGWADTGDAAAVAVTVTRADGTTEVVDGVRVESGRFVADADLSPGDTAAALPGQVVDAYGNTNA